MKMCNSLRSPYLNVVVVEAHFGKKKKKANGKKKPNNITKDEERRINKKRKTIRHKWQEQWYTGLQNSKKASKESKWAQGSLKEGSSKPMGIVRNRKQVRMGQRSPKKGISKGGWYKSQQITKVKDMPIGSAKSKKFSKKPMGM